MYLSTETVAKSVWLHVAAVGVCLCTVPPQPIPSEKLREKYSDPTTATNGDDSAGQPAVARSPTSPRFDYKETSAKFSLSYFPYIFSAWVVLMAALDAFHALDLYPRVTPGDHIATARSAGTFNAQLVVGLVLTTVFSALRFTAFRTLGKFFTYQLSILPNHKLVTHGLYSYVRHPSYTAVPFVLAGVLLTVTAPGSTLYDCIGVDWTRRLMIVSGLEIIVGAYVFMRRAGIEDQVLRKEFGKEWEEWARVVRYKFIPGVL